MQMREVREQYDVGVIVGRFQVPDLHDAHSALIQHVCDQHDKVVIFLGLSPLMVTQENPLDFESRKQMILEKFPEVNVLYIKDMYDDKLWSRRLDEMVGDVVTPAQSVVLYGGRDSFIKRYHGKLPTRELEQDTYISGSEVRRAVSRRSVKSSPDFRAGVVWAAFGRFPTVYTCVDIAIVSEDGGKLLMGRKAGESMYRFIGGFADPASANFEQDARREVMEETGISITDPVYVGSHNVDDWRYRGEADKIRTMLFVAKYQFGAPRAADDIAEVKWLDWHGMRGELVMPNHRPLLDALAEYNEKAQILRRLVYRKDGSVVEAE